MCWVKISYFVVIALFVQVVGCTSRLADQEALPDDDILTPRAAVADAVAALQKLQRSGALETGSRAVIVSGFKDRLNRSCDSDMSLKIKGMLTQGITSSYRLDMDLIAIDNAADIIDQVYKGETLDLGEMFTGEVILANEFSKSIHKGLSAPEYKFKVIDVKTGVLLTSRTYRLSSEYLADFLRPVACDCSRLCTGYSSHSQMESVFNRMDEKKYCDLNIAGNMEGLLTLQSCDAYVNKQAFGSGQFYSFDELATRCRDCDARIPTKEELEVLAVCRANRQSVEKVPCRVGGNVYLCTLSAGKLFVSNVSKRQQSFKEFYCVF